MCIFVNWVLSVLNIIKQGIQHVGKSVKFYSQNCFVSMALIQWHYNMDQQSAHTLSLIMYTSECPKKTAYTASLPKSL